MIQQNSDFLKILFLPKTVLEVQISGWCRSICIDWGRFFVHDEYILICKAQIYAKISSKLIN